MRTTIAQPAAIVQAVTARVFAKAPMIERLLENQITVIAGSGSTKLKMTWLTTSACVRSTPDCTTKTAGVIVTSRLSHSGMRKPTKPYITT